MYLIKWEFDKMGFLKFSGEELTHTFLVENGNSIKGELDRFLKIDRFS